MAKKTIRQFTGLAPPIIALAAVFAFVLGGCDEMTPDAQTGTLSTAPAPYDPDTTPQCTAPRVPSSGAGVKWRLVRDEDPSKYWNGSFFDVTWGSGRFVTVGLHRLKGDGNHWRTIYHSNDGERWIVASDNAYPLILSDPELVRPIVKSVVWSGSRFVAVGPSHVILYSNDGDRWTPASESIAVWAPWEAGNTPGGYGFTDVTWGGSRFVAVNGDSRRGRTILYSSDGDHWEKASRSVANPHNPFAASIDSHTLSGVASNGSLFVAVGIHGTILYSSDAHNWTEASDDFPLFAFFGDVTWGGDRFVAVGSNNLTFGAPPIAYSHDGKRWTEARYSRVSSRYDDVSLNAVTWSGDLFIAVGGRSITDASGARAGSGVILYSRDGNCWSEASVGNDTGLNGVTWGNGRFVAVGGDHGSQGGVVFVSP